MALLSMRDDRFWKKTWKKISIQGIDVAGFLLSQRLNALTTIRWVTLQGSAGLPEAKTEEGETTTDKENHALVADKEASTKFALIAKTSAKSKVFNNSLCSKDWLAQVKSRLAEHRDRELKYCEKIRGLEFKTESGDDYIESLKKELELIKKEKDGLDSKLTGFQIASKDLDSLLESQRLDKNKEGLGYSADDTVTDYSRPAPTIESSPDDAQNKNHSVTETEASPTTISLKSFIKFVKANDSPTNSKTDKAETAKKPHVKYAEQYRKPTKKPNGSSQNNIDDKGYWDSGCSRHMTGNISYLSDYEPFDRGYVSFGQGGCKITGKVTIKTGKLEFENVYFVKDLKSNPFSVSKICDNKNNILFTNSECIVLGQNFKLSDDDNVLLMTPRQHNMYSIDLNNIFPHKDLTCLVAKASADECMLWHRRLGHLNFKTMNKLVRHNLVRGLPTKCFENDHTCTACLKGKQHKASCKSKLVNSVSKPLYTLHMDLFGPTSNGVAKRRNKTLIEVARTMLADAKLPVTFWAEVVSTASYVQNMVFVNKSQNKTPYELFNGRTPIIGFLKLFGCHVMIFNTLENLGKFEAKGDEGTKDAAGQEVKKDVSSLRYIALPNWVHDALLESSSSKPQDDCSTDVPKSSGNSNPTATSTNPPADQLETLTVENPIPTVSSPVPTACLNDSQEPSSDTRLISKRVANQVVTPSLDNILTLINRFEDILGVTTNSVDSDGVEADMDMKNAFLYGTIDEEVYVMQPPGFQDPEFLEKVYKVEKAIELEALMHEKFQMSVMGELNFFLGLQVLKKEDGIFLSQDKYVGDILKKIRYSDVRSSNTPMDKKNPWGKDRTRKDVDLHLYRSMIGSLMYLTTSRPDIMFAVCTCARHQVTPEESYSDSDYGGATQDRKSTTGGCQFLGRRLISWQCKKQTIVATSTTVAEYVTAASCCGQVLWIQN
nr:ribonuclease H-like domain-containing protein [Tanacetum cinerariifolium]